METGACIWQLHSRWILQVALSLKRVYSNQGNLQPYVLCFSLSTAADCQVAHFIAVK